MDLPVTFACECLPCFSSKMLLLSQHFRLRVVFSWVISPRAPEAEDSIMHLHSLAAGCSAWLQGAHPAANLPSSAYQLWHLLLGQLGRTFLPALPSSYRGEGSSGACVKSAVVCGLPSQGPGRVKPTRCIWVSSSANTILGCGTASLSCLPPGMQDTCFSSYSWAAKLNKKTYLAKKSAIKFCK